MLSPSIPESTGPSTSPERLHGPGRTIGTSLAGLKILLVEDFEDNQRLIKTFLRQEGAEVDLASNGAEGVEKAKANQYSVVFMDIQMPVLNGFEALNAPKAMHYPRPVVALTANAMKGEQERCIAAGFTDYCPKPVERKRIIELARIYGSPALPSADA